MTTKRSLRSWPRSSISLKTSIIGSDFIRPLATCRRLSLKPRFHHKYFLNYLCHFRGALQSLFLLLRVKPPLIIALFTTPDDESSNPRLGVTSSSLAVTLIPHLPLFSLMFPALV